MRIIFSVILFGAFTSSAAIPEIPYQTFTYSQTACSNYRSNSGSQIFIPEHAFVARDGQVCRDTITIRYREFHSQADIVIGSIPMDFLQGKNASHLESAGMFEIYADCDGTEMKLATGKKLQVRFASRQKMDGLNAFYFDNGWQLLPMPVIDMSFDPGDKYNTTLWGESPPQVNINGIPLREEWLEGDWVGIEDPYYALPETKTEPVIFMGMDIAQMGLFNYDRILNEEQSIPFVVDFKIKGEKISLDSKIYVTYSGLNTVVYYTPEEWDKKFSLLPRKDIKIFCMLKDGRVAVLMPDELEKVDLKSLRNKKHTFELVVGDIKPETKEQLASVAGIQP
jgi:hypothetical protein